MILPLDPNQWPEANYDIVYADPPWPYKDKSMQRGGAARHYRPMPLEEICALPVQRLCSPQSMLFLWITWPNLFMAEKAMEAWGFDYVTGAFDWFKTNKDGTLFMGMGHTSRANSEPCLLGRRMKVKGVKRSPLKVLDHGVPMAQLGRRGKHSAKPAKFRKSIERLYGNVPRIELFARSAEPGWDAWGDQLTVERNLIFRNVEQESA